jgi:alanine transaminase
MIPFLQYPLYSESITFYVGNQVGYYLNEEQNWALSIAELDRAHNEASKKGIHIRVLVVINPGNLTKSVLNRDNITQVIQFCLDRGLVFLADEIYQHSIYDHSENKEQYVHFHSFNKVMYEMGV